MTIDLKKYHVAHNFFNVINEDNESEAVEKVVGSGYLDEAFLLAYRLTQISQLELNRKNVMDYYEKVSEREYVIFNTTDVLAFIDNPLSFLHEAYSDYLVNGVLYEDNQEYKPDFDRDKINFNDFSPSIENCFILEEQLYYLLEWLRLTVAANVFY